MSRSTKVISTRWIRKKSQDYLGAQGTFTPIVAICRWAQPELEQRDLPRGIFRN